MNDDLTITLKIIAKQQYNKNFTNDVIALDSIVY